MSGPGRRGGRGPWCEAEAIRSGPVLVKAAMAVALLPARLLLRCCGGTVDERTNSRSLGKAGQAGSSSLLAFSVCDGLGSLKRSL